MPAGGADVALSIPAAVLELMDRLRANGQQAYVVGGSLRDRLLDRTPIDWDLTTDARPERLLELFPQARYENAFGTVQVDLVEITTFRSDHEYADFRRPHHVEFGDRVELDLARRDFTVNAMAWGGAPGEPSHLVDPFGGRRDTERRLLRAVGDPSTRFGEDALRMLRAARLAAVLEFTVEPATRAALASSAHLAGHLSGERIVAELGKLLDAPRPSIGLRILADAGLLAAIAPPLDAQRGVAQNKIPGEDLWDHVVRSVDATAAAGRRRTVRWAALVHDIGKPVTAADGHFYGHDVVGAELAGDLLRGWHAPRETIDEVTHLVRQHMFAYDDAWSDGAVRRFIAKVRPERLDDLFALREADSLGSGIPADAGALTTLRNRVAAELAANVALDLRGLSIDGDDLIRELGLAPGPAIGRVLHALLERVMNEPDINRPATLLALARELAATMSDSAATSTGRPAPGRSREAG
ncbi:MAG TPA: HD domain-containing protein [Candidatus Limnocylindrales bacterium]